MANIQRFIAGHGFEITGDRFCIPWVNVKTGETGNDWFDIPTSMKAAKELLGY